MAPIECLRDCDAACCRMQQNHRVIFDFTPQEVSMFEERGAVLYPQPEGGYTMPEDCTFLDGKLCVLHGQPAQPECCAANKAGGVLCLQVRASVAGIRRSEVE